MALKLYDTKSRRKEPFTPVAGEVRMYVCGPTVYDHAHLGHARSYVGFDVVRRYLEFSGHRVRHVQNFTDVEDVITKRAQAAGMEPLAYAEKFIRAYHEDMDALNVQRAHTYARVSEHIPEILDAVKAVIAKGFGYAVDGDVYFRTRQTEHSFGILTHQRFDDIVADPLPPDSEKEDPLDFAVWKRSRADEPGWDSPWGRGRPGWHIECFAMASKYLGPQVDIHGGGKDLKFPHHESEAMICEAVCGTDWARYWMHNGFLTMASEKMSKSLGNFITIREVLGKWGGEVVRFCLLKEQYRKDVEYDADCFKVTREELDGIHAAISRARAAKGEGGGGDLVPIVSRAREKFFAALDDDFNTREAVYALLELTEAVGETAAVSEGDGRELLAFYREASRVLGVFEEALAP
ncbi:MAG: cysteine--tRNA ligase [Euryarchaeota archaeon RBG_16_68_12]|nr:MAG: cysteine--tRNA ligase [Euryarchaeota archaeon RBG_16_68_12]